MDFQLYKLIIILSRFPEKKKFSILSFFEDSRIFIKSMILKFGTRPSSNNQINTSSNRYIFKSSNQIFKLLSTLDSLRATPHL